MDAIKEITITQPATDHAVDHAALEKAATHYDMALTYANIGRHAKALEYLRRSLALFRESVGEDDAYAVWARGTISLIERAMGIRSKKS